MCVSSHGSILYLLYYKGCALEIQQHSKIRCHALTHLIVLWRNYDKIKLSNFIKQRKSRMGTRINRQTSKSIHLFQVINVSRYIISIFL